jgi:hypothetical protein
MYLMGTWLLKHLINFTGMHKNLKAVLFALIFVALVTFNVCARENEWLSPVTGKTLGMKVLEPKGFQAAQPSPLIIYLENLAAPRVGTDSDDAIIHDFLDKGYVMVTLDYKHNSKACVPFINADILEMRKQVLGKKFISGLEIDPSHVFVVPSGCRLLPDVIFYKDPERTLAMDIIYPSNPARPVGAIIEFSCDNLNRMGDSSLVICSDTMLDGEATEGFAVAMADHPVPPPYKGLDPVPDCAWKIKAAVRTLRIEGSKLGFNEKIAPIGFSRGSGMALMLATTMGIGEFEGHGENTNANSDVQGAIVMSGRFTYLDLLPNDHMIPRYDKAWGDRTNHLDFWRREGAMDYLSKPTLPLFLTIDCSEQPDALYQMAALRKHLAELGNDEIFMTDPQPRGHKVTLVPEILTAMNNYLKGRLN